VVTQRRRCEMKAWQDTTNHLDVWLPSLRDLAEVTAPMTADTILQILHGQAAAFGLGMYAALWQDEPKERPKHYIRKVR
jgi:hypothetical protein